MSDTQQRILKPLSWLLSGDFAPPKDACELLDRAVEFSEDEKRWASGDFLCAIGLKEELLYQQTPICNNVSACAMGILVICNWNGPAVESWLLESDVATLEIDGGTYSVSEYLVARDKVASLAARYFASQIPGMKGVRQVHYKEYFLEETLQWAFSENIQRVIRKIISFNDKTGDWNDDNDECDYPPEEIAEHHQRIVTTFKNARDLAYTDRAAGIERMIPVNWFES